MSEAAAPTSDFQDLPRQALLVGLSLLALAVGLFPLREPDAFLSLARGLELLSQGPAVAGPDWFHDLVLALVLRGNGPTGPVVLRLVLLFLYAILAFGFLLARGLRPVAASLVMAATFLGLHPFLSAGPDLSGLLLTGGLFFLLVRGPRRGIRWTLPLLFLLWANVAGSSAVAGLAAAALYALGLVPDALMRHGGEWEAGPGRTLLHLPAGVALAAVFTLLNPATTQVWALALRPDVRAWEVFWSLPGWLGVVLLLVASLVVFALAPGARRRLPHLLCGAGLGAGALLLQGPWALVLAGAWPFLAASLLTGWLGRSREETVAGEAAGRPGAAWGVSLLVLVLALAVVADPSRPVGLGLDQAAVQVPEEAAVRVRQERLPGPVGGREAWYGYLAWRFTGTAWETTRDPAEARTWIGIEPPPGEASWRGLEGGGRARIWVRGE